MPWSMTCVCASRKGVCVACLGTGALPRTAHAIEASPCPDTLTTPMPPRPCGVAIAAMVSGFGDDAFGICL